MQTETFTLADDICVLEMWENRLVITLTNTSDPNEKYDHVVDPLDLADLSELLMLKSQQISFERGNIEIIGSTYKFNIWIKAGKACAFALVCLKRTETDRYVKEYARMNKQRTYYLLQEPMQMD